MKNRPIRRGVRCGGFLSGLESRSLPSAGVAGVADALRNLGPVSRSAAIAGVEATALINSGDSVTFRFEIEAGGNYTLLIRHTNDGLKLDAASPSGSSPINPGPSGTFQVVPLRLDSTTYEVTASARGGRPVFVDWELLLNTGVSQSALSGPGTVLPPLTLPTPAPTPPSTSAIVEVVAAPTAPLGSEPAQSSTWLTAGKPVGHPTLELSSLPEVASTAPKTLDTLDPLDESQPISPVDVALIEALMPAIGSQPVNGNEVPSIEIPWWSRFFETNLGQSSGSVADGSRAEFGPLPTDTAEPVTLSSDTGETRLSVAMISPGLLLGVTAVTIASRGRIVRNRKFFERNSMPLSPHAFQLDLHQIH